MALNGVDPSAKTPSRIRRDWARLTKGAATANILAAQPIAINASGNLSLNLATNPGLTPSGQALSILLQTNSGLALGATGLKIGALTTKGDLLAFGTFSTRLAVGTNDQILIADSSQSLGVKWGSSIGNLTISGTATVGTLAITGTATNGTFLAGAVGGPPTAPSFRAIAANDLPGLLNDTSFGNVTITSSLTLPNQNANLVYAGPTTGAGNHPAFRSLVAADLPGGNWVGNTNGETTLGAPFTLSTNATYSNTGLTVSLPAAGTYRVEGQIRASMGTSMTTAFVTAKLFNSTAAADVANSTVLVAILPTPQATAYLGSTVTVAGATTIALFAQLTFTGVLAPTQVQSDSNGWTKLAYTRIA